MIVGIAAVIALPILIALAFSTPTPALTPEELETRRLAEALAAHYQDLDAGKLVHLIGPSGRPSYFQWRTDPRLGGITDAPDGSLCVSHGQFGRLELLPDPRHVHFLYSAEVQHHRGAVDESAVGIYFSHSQHEAATGSVHCYFDVAFHDWILQNSPRIGNSLPLQGRRDYTAGISKHAVYIRNTRSYFTPAILLPLEKEVWRKVQVEVSPQIIRIFWDNKCVASAPRADVNIDLLPLINRLEEPLDSQPRFAPRGGLGLFVGQGAASFRNVTVQPLD
jgi:hypothetical protein